MDGLEDQADNAKARDLYWNPLSWLGTIRPASANDAFDPALWTMFWCWCGAAAHAARSLAACARGPPSSTSSSTSCLFRPVLRRRPWRVVGWVDILLDVIGGVESALWEGCYPALTLAPTCGANRASGVYQRWFSSTLHTGWGTVWQPSLSSGVSDAPWLNLRLPGSLYSVIGHE